MNSSDEVLKLQTQLSECSGTKKLAEWLLVLGLVVLVGNVVSAFAGKESVLKALSSSLPILVLCLHMRSTAKRRAFDLEKQLG